MKNNSLRILLRDLKKTLNSYGFQLKRVVEDENTLLKNIEWNHEIPFMAVIPFVGCKRPLIDGSTQNLGYWIWFYDPLPMGRERFDEPSY